MRLYRIMKKQLYQKATFHLDKIHNHSAIGGNIDFKFSWGGEDVIMQNMKKDNWIFWYFDKNVVRLKKKWM